MSSQLALNLRLRDASSFRNFLPARNHEALAGLRSVCAAIARDEPPPERVLFLWGAAGSGRTHLLQAACRAVHESGHPALYFSATDAPTLAPAVLENAEQAELVCVDDVEHIAHLPGWERALFALCERMRAANHALVIAGARAPQTLGLELADLVTRLGWGPVYQLELLDDAEKLEALRQRARNRGFEVSDEVVRYVLARYPRDMASLFELLDRIDIASLASKRRVTIPFLRALEEGARGKD